MRGEKPRGSNTSPALRCRCTCSRCPHSTSRQYQNLLVQYWNGLRLAGAAIESESAKLASMATVTRMADLEQLPDIEELFLQSDPGAAAQRLQPTPAVTNVRDATKAACATAAVDGDADDEIGLQPQVPGTQRLWIRRVGPMNTAVLLVCSPGQTLCERCHWRYKFNSCERLLNVLAHQKDATRLRRCKHAHYVQDFRLQPQHIGL